VAGPLVPAQMEAGTKGSRPKALFPLVTKFNHKIATIRKIFIISKLESTIISTKHQSSDLVIHGNQSGYLLAHGLAAILKKEKHANYGLSRVHGPIAFVARMSDSCRSHLPLLAYPYYN
jgi:hypothetical protein